MRGPNRDRKPGRREPFRDPRPTVLIFCEGEKTEREYFEKFALHYRNARVKVKVADKTGVPASLVEFARKFKREIEKQAKRRNDGYIAYDSVWCVFDIDDHPRVPEARDKAAANGIALAISNPCFELWLVLHLRDNPGMRGRNEIQDLLKTLDPDYASDFKSVAFPRYAPGYDAAVKRARRLDTLARDVGTPGHNPTTNVHELTELILKGRD